MSLPNITTVFFSGTYDAIVQIATKSIGSFYYAQDKDAWYQYSGSPVRLRRISDIYVLDTEKQRIDLLKSQIFEKKLYIVKETGIAWWNNTGDINDWLPIGIKSELRDLDEELIGINTSKKGYVQFYSTEKLRKAVNSALTTIDEDWIKDEIDKLNKRVDDETKERKDEDDKLQKQIDDNKKECDNENTERKQEIIDLTERVHQGYHKLKSMIEAETQARLSAIIEIDLTISNAKNEFTEMIQQHKIDTNLSISELKQWIIDYTESLIIFLYNEAENQQIKNIAELTEIINQYISNLIKLINDELLDVDNIINELRNLIERYNTEIRNIIDNEITVAISSVTADLKNHIGSIGVENHGLATGVIAGFSQANFTNTMKEKLELLDPGAISLESSVSIIIDSITKQIQRAALTGDVVAAVNSNNTSISDNAVTTRKINNNAITTDKIDNDAVTSLKLATGSVITQKIADSAVSTIKINDSAVTTDKLVNNAVTNQKIANEAVSTSKLENKAVTNSKLADMPANTIKGRMSSEGPPQDLTPAQIRTLINVSEGAMTYVHPTHPANSSALSGRTVYSCILVNTLGHVTGFSTREITLDDFLNNSTTNTIVGTQIQRTALTGEVTAPANSNTLTITGKAVTNPKLADMNANTIKGRISSNGEPQDLSPANIRTIINVADGANNYVHPIHPVRNVIALSGRKVFSNIFINNEGHVTGVNDRDMIGTDILVNSTTTTIVGNEVQRTALVGDVTAPANNNTTTIVAKAVTNAKMADMVPQRIKGRFTSSDGPPEDLTATQIRSIINVANGANNYSHPTLDTFSLSLTGRNVISQFEVNDNGHVIAINTRGLTAGNIIDNSTSITVVGNQVQRAALTGDVTSPANSNVTTIANNAVTTVTINALAVTTAKIDVRAVTNQKLNDMNANTIKGRMSSNGEPQDLIPSEVRTMLSVYRIIGNGTSAPPSSLGVDGDIYLQYI